MHFVRLITWPALLFGFWLEPSLACSRPLFADDAVAPLRAQKVDYFETQGAVPGHADRCVYLATWIARRTELGGQVNLYAATYRNNGLKISDTTLETEIDMLWFGPQAHLSGQGFPISRRGSAFGVSISTVFWAGTFGEDKTHFVLLWDDDGGALRPLLERRASFTYQRDCERSPCSEDDVGRGFSFTVEKQVTRGFRDITVREFEHRSSPKGGRKPRERLVSVTRLRWDGTAYIPASAETSRQGRPAK